MAPNFQTPHSLEQMLIHFRIFTILFHFYCGVYAMFYKTMVSLPYFDDHVRLLNWSLDLKIKIEKWVKWDLYILRLLHIVI